MSTKVKESLFELIRSLSKSEKRYFKLLASRHTIGVENNYVRLFDAIDRQEIYDEEGLFKEFKGKAMLNKFSITKKRLYDQIISALDGYHSSTSLDAQLYKGLHSVEILYNKSLYDQAGRMIRSLEKQAMKNERLVVLQEINRWKKKLLENQGHQEGQQEELIEISKLDNDLQHTYATYNHLWMIKAKLFTQLHTKGVARNEDEIQFFKELQTDMPDVRDVHVFDIQSLNNHVMSAIHYGLRETKLSSEYINRNIELYQKIPNKISEFFNFYLSLLTNAIYLNESLGERMMASQYLQDLKRLTDAMRDKINEDQRIKLFGSVSSVELSVLCRRGDFSKALSLLPSIESGIMLFQDKLTPSRVAYMQFKGATVCFTLGNYNEALRWINKIRNNNSLDSSEDVLAFTALLEILIHLEMDHKTLLPYSLKNTLRFLKSRNRLHEVEQVFLSFISKRIKLQDTFEINELWENLLHDLEKLDSNALQNAALEYFDFCAWAKSKVEKRPYDQIIREKQGARLRKVS